MTNWKKVAIRRVVTASLLFIGAIAAVMSPASDRIRTQQWINSSVAEFNQGRNPDFAKGMRLVSTSVTSSQCQEINDLWYELTEHWNETAQAQGRLDEANGIGLALPLNFSLALASDEGQHLPFGAQSFRSILVTSCPDDLKW